MEKDIARNGSGVSGVQRFVCQDLHGLEYKAAATIESIAKQYGIPLEKMIKLNANENSYGRDIEQLNTAPSEGMANWYPDSAQRALRSKLSDVFGIPMKNICCGAGSDDILDIIMRMMRPSKVVTSTPTFGMYSFLAKVSGIEVVNVPRNEDFTVNTDLLIETIQTQKIPLVMLPSPNNPTGTLLPKDDVIRLLKEDCVVVIDEAYVEFTDESIVDLFGTYENLIVSRTFSKWAGLAGLRIGYCFAHEEFVTTMLAIKQPYNISTAAEKAALVALEQRPKIMGWVKALREEKDRLYNLLLDDEKFPNLHPVPSEANFVLIKVTGPKSAESIYKEMCKHGILIRYFGSQGGDLSKYIRISAGRKEEIDAALAALQEIMGSE